MCINTCATEINKNQLFLLMHKRPTLHGKNWPVSTYTVAPFQRDRKGTGPEEGWVSIKLTGKDLVVPYVEIGELFGSLGMFLVGKGH